MAIAPEVTADIMAQSMTMLERMETDELGDLAITLEDMQYQGFVPKKFLAHMWALGRAAGMDQEAHMKAVKSMACLGLIRGSKLTKMRSGGNANLQRAVADWVRIYKLTDGKPTGPKAGFTW